MRCLELLIREDKVTSDDWQTLVEKISSFDKNFFLEISFETNTVAFYLYNQRDLSSLTSELDKFVLKPTERSLLTKEELSIQTKIKFKLSSKKQILDQKENEQVKRQRTLEKVYINFWRFLNIKFYFMTLIFNSPGEGRVASVYTTLTNPLGIFEFDFENNVKVKKRSVPLFLKIDEVVPLFTPQSQDSFLEVAGFPNFSYPVYFPLDKFEFDKHSLIVGQTGVGKSKMIELFIKNLAKYKPDEYSVVIIDPHASLYSQFLNMGQSVANLDFIHSSCNLFPSFAEPKIAIELTILLFKTLLKEQFNAKMERVLKYCLYVLFLKNQMSLLALKRFLTELEFRKEILAGLEEQYSYLNHFFETEFVEMQTQFYEVAIMPVLVLVDELSFIPAFSSNNEGSLDEALQSNFLTCFSLNRIFLGEKATRLIAGLIIQQLFLLSQKGLSKKVILIIDEVSLVENDSLISILSEARKFGLSLFLSQQYLTQISPDLLKGILSNIYNYFVFKISDEDAQILAKNMDISFPDDVLIKQKEKGLEDNDLKRNLLTTLNPREVIVRAFANDKFNQCFKAKTMEVY